MVSLTLELAENKLKGTGADLTAFGPKEQEKVRNFHASMWGFYHPAPLVTLPRLAARFAVKQLLVKDESKRFGQQAVHTLAVSYALASYLAEKYQVELSFDALQEHNFALQEPWLTIVAVASDNYGRALAWFSHLLGIPTILYVPAGASAAYVADLQALEAKVRVTTADYAGTRQLAAQTAAQQGWLFLPEEGTAENPSWPVKLMQGYTTSLAEIMEELPDPPTHVFLQAGSGLWAAGIQAALQTRYQQAAPVVVLLEPEAANCYYRSFTTGMATSVRGVAKTIMADLAAGCPQPAAWSILAPLAGFSLSCHEEVAALGMRILSAPLPGDSRLAAGPAGALGAGVIGLFDRYHNLKSAMGITRDSVLLLFNTEGPGCSEQYQEFVWGGALPCSLGGKSFA